MICQRCIYRATARTSTKSPSTSPSHIPPLNRLAAHHPPQSHRTITTTPHPSQQLPSAAASTQAKGAPPTLSPSPTSTSPSPALPYTTPYTSSLTPFPPANASSKPSALPTSSVPEGTLLKGLNYLKGQGELIALDDGEYPAWLWGCLDGVGEKGKREGGEGGEEGDLFSKSKKQRRIAAKKLRKQAVLHPESLVPKIPIQQQSVDLPVGDGSLRGALGAAEKRAEVTRAMRGERRRGIKEANFLKGM